MSTITPDLITQHQLTGSEYDKIVSILGREPSYTELGIRAIPVRTPLGRESLPQPVERTSQKAVKLSWTLQSFVLVLFACGVRKSALC